MSKSLRIVLEIYYSETFEEKKRKTKCSTAVIIFKKVQNKYPGG